MSDEDDEDEFGDEVAERDDVPVVAEDQPGDEDQSLNMASVVVQP